MDQRWMSIWFPHLKTDWLARRRPSLKKLPFVLTCSQHGKMIITAANNLSQSKGITIGMSLADARAFIPGLEVLEDRPEICQKLLVSLAEWCIRYSPVVSIDLPEGLMINLTGCAHLWGGESNYIQAIIKRFNDFGYQVKAAISDTIGTSWAVARFGENRSVISKGQQLNAIQSLPPAALRLESEIVERLEKLGLRKIEQFIDMPRTTLRRRFGQQILHCIDQALGITQETKEPVKPLEPYQERLPCLEPISTITGIEIALHSLLNTLCQRLQKEQKGLRNAVFMGFRIDGKMEKISIATTRPSCNPEHLFKLLEIKLSTIEPALGIELFILESSIVEPLPVQQDEIWRDKEHLNNHGFSELLDRIGEKIGLQNIYRFLPDEHHWPERSYKKATTLYKEDAVEWPVCRPRPLRLLPYPQAIEVTAPIPDYPPMLFRHKGKLHKIIKADGPERIESEWWLQECQHRDYYCVEDEEGCRYWIFRDGHYEAGKLFQWFLHGFFA